MTRYQLINELRGLLPDIEGTDGDMAAGTLTAGQLLETLHRFNDVLREAIIDPATPCEHLGSRYEMLDGQRCGVCTRIVSGTTATDSSSMATASGDSL